MVGQDIPRSASPHSTMTDKGENKKGENKKEQRVEVAVLDGDLQGPALTWLSTASQADAVAFFRHMGEDIGHLPAGKGVAAAGCAIASHPRLSDFVIRKLLCEYYTAPVLEPRLYDIDRFVRRPDLLAPAGAGDAGASGARGGDPEGDRPDGELTPLPFGGRQVDREHLMIKIE